MSINNIYSQLVIVAGVIAMLIIASRPERFRKDGQGQQVRPRHGPHNGFQLFQRRCTRELEFVSQWQRQHWRNIQ